MAQTKNISSSDIKVFPTSRRNDLYDRNARLNSEQNLISIINRLTGIKSFMISGLDVSTSGNTITIQQGECNINGYYFRILNPISLTVSNDDTHIYFEIKVQENYVNIAESSSIKFEELIGGDIEDRAGSVYEGLVIATYASAQPLEEVQDTITVIRLLIATRPTESEQWFAVANRTPFTANQIEITTKDNLTTDPRLNSVTTSLQALIFNLDTLIIDDGEIDAQ